MKINKKFFIYIIITLSLSLFVSSSVLAQNSNTNNSDDTGGSLIRQGIVDTGTAADLGNEDSDFRIVMAKIVRGLLSFLGIIFTLLIIYGGFTWMTAGGNEENVSRAKKIITQASIGLIVVILAYALSSFIFNMIRDVTDENL